MNFPPGLHPALRSAADAHSMKELFVFTNHSNFATAGLCKAAGGIAPNGEDCLFVYPADGPNQIA